MMDIVFWLTGLALTVWVAYDTVGPRHIEQIYRANQARRIRRSPSPPADPLDSIHEVKSGETDALPAMQGVENVKWVDKLLLTSSGDIVRTIDCMLLNTSDESHADLKFATYSDDPATEPSDYWAKQDGRSARITLTWDPQKGVGYFTIDLRSELASNQVTRIQYGYTLTDVMKEGSDYWEKPITVRTDVYRASVAAQKPWAITAPRAQVLTADRRPAAAQTPRLLQRGGAVYWTVHRPPLGTRLRIDWNTVNSSRFA